MCWKMQADIRPLQCGYWNLAGRPALVRGEAILQTDTLKSHWKEKKETNTSLTLSSVIWEGVK